MIRLQQLRLDGGLTVSQLADKAGLTPATVYRLERTGKVGEVASLVKLAKALDVEPSSLVMPAIPPKATEDVA